MDCAFAPWGTWEPCPVTCGGGTQTSARVVDTPAQNGGTCHGNLIREQTCNQDPCPGKTKEWDRIAMIWELINLSVTFPVDCTWAVWGEWGSCSSTCGQGRQTSSRIVDQQELHGGKPCTGKSERNQPCMQEECILPGYCNILSVSTFATWWYWRTFHLIFGYCTADRKTFNNGQPRPSQRVGLITWNRESILFARKAIYI